MMRGDDHVDLPSRGVVRTAVPIYRFRTFVRAVPSSPHAPTKHVCIRERVFVVIS